MRVEQRWELGENGLFHEVEMGNIKDPHRRENFPDLKVGTFHGTRAAVPPLKRERALCLSIDHRVKS